MRYANIIKNDCINGEGVCVSLWLQGCDIKCPGCHNFELWDFNGGHEAKITTVIAEICEALIDNNIERNFSILGGEPLAKQNINNTNVIANFVRKTFPNIKIFLWTGYTLEQLFEMDDEFHQYSDWLNWADYIITGPYIEDQRNITLWLRGSENQQVYKIENHDLILVDH